MLIKITDLLKKALKESSISLSFPGGFKYNFSGFESFALMELDLQTCKTYVFYNAYLKWVSTDEELLLHCKLYGSSPVGWQQH